ncbi:MAG TPA: C25 family cysteine peptidase [Candidatus Thermoplasmatota archaeon]|nr:C25 family cysteine peptidase [Candidatus Thermoplasmatota archaeon]
MKKIFVGISVILLLLSGTLISADSFQTTEISHTKETLPVDSITTIEQDEVTIFNLPTDFEYMNKPGFPQIPTVTKKYYFPSETSITDISAQVSSIETQHIEKPIQITPEPVLSSNGAQPTQVIKRYDPSAPVPKDWITWNVGHGLVGDEHKQIVTITFYPVKYTESTETLEIAEDIFIDISHSRNKEESHIQSVANEENYEFIILTPTDFEDTLQPLADHKLSRNISTKIVPLNFVYNGMYFPPQGRDDQEKIKYFIKEAIEQWNTKNAMLVGGSDDFPVRATHVYVDYNEGDAEVFASDLYYADIYNETLGFSSWDTNNNDIFGEYNWEDETDDVDLYPDIHLGRLAVTSEDELTGVVNKIINYENGEAYKQDWFSDLIVIGGDTTPNDDEEIDEGEYVNQEVINIMDGFIPIKLWASLGNLGSTSSVSSTINEGAGFIDFSGHGNPSLWATHPHNKENVWIPLGNYKNTHVLTLINSEKLPVVVTGACSVGKFTVRDDCFTWNFVSNPNGGGIAAFGTTALSWGYSGTWAIEGLGGKMQTELFKAYREHGAITVGEMWLRGISNYISPRMDSGDHKTVEEWILFGDPTLAIAEDSDPPLKPTLNGPTSGAIDEEQTYEALTTDPEGDAVFYMFDWGDDTYSEWFGPYESGEPISASYTWTEKGDYEIRVKAKDDHGVMGEWSDPLPISMPNSFSWFAPFDWLVNWFSSFFFF